MCLIKAQAEIKCENIDCHCPLTADYLLKELEKMKPLTKKNDEKRQELAYKHSLRMATEVLSDTPFYELKTKKDLCSYFFIGVHIKSLNSKHNQNSLQKERDALKKNIENCMKWVNTKFVNHSTKIKSTYCE